MKRMNLSRSVVAGLGLIVACAACCALPLLLGAGATGLLSGVAAELRGFNGWLVGGIVTVLVAVAAAVVKARRGGNSG